MSVLVLVLAAGAARAAEPSESWNTALGEIDAVFGKFAAQTHAPGLVYGIVREGRLAYVRGIGVQDMQSKTPVNPDTVFRIASLTKSFTALAVLNLRDEGRLNLDTPVVNIVPELKVLPPPNSDAHLIRICQLLNHAAGFVTDDPWGDRQLDMTEPAFSRFLQSGVPLARGPGEVFEYSDTGYALLGRVISNVSGQRFQDYIAQLILKPLSMTATTWEIRDVPPQRRAVGYSWIDDHLEEQPALSDGAYGAMAGLSTSATDYGRYIAWLLAAWGTNPSPAQGLVDPSTIREAGRGTILSQVGRRPDGPDGKACPVAWLYGAGFYVVTDCELGKMLRHPGGLPGYGSQILLLPRAGVGIFAFANLTYAHLIDPVLEAAVRLKRAGLINDIKTQPSPPLTRAAAAALRMYEAGDVRAAQDELAINVLLDRSAERRNTELRDVRKALGACVTITPADIQHALAGRFSLTCKHGTLEIAITLTPTWPPKIQSIQFDPRPTPAPP